MTLTRLALFLCASLLGTGAFAAERAAAISLLGSQLSKPDDKHRPMLEDGYGLELRYGFGTDKAWGYELRAFHGVLNFKDQPGERGNRSGMGVDAVYRAGPLLGFAPYAFAGVALSYSDALAGRDWIAPGVNAGVGLASGAVSVFGGKPLRLRAEWRYSYEDYRDEYTAAAVYDPGNYADQHLFLGLELGLGKPPPPRPAPAPVRVVEPVPAPEAPL